ncbi:hypothetical protein GCM10010174_19830 [Kutzneria viridogrisea]|nr:hypothetical protein [Kutzneria albida]MBA8923101.1 hypothetical protein [Kutzneria viridogrisea]
MPSTMVLMLSSALLLPTWTPTPVPAVSGGSSLDAVSAVSTKDAWAVGIAAVSS